MSYLERIIEDGETLKIPNPVEITGQLTATGFQSEPGGIAYYADSVLGKNDNDGKTPATAVQSITKALSFCRESKGDTIHCLPGHVETVSAAGGLTFNKIGVRVFFHGRGNTKATIQFTGTAATLLVTAANVELYSPRFLTGIDAVVAAINPQAADFKMYNVEYYDAAAKATTIQVLTTSAANRLVIDGYKYFASTTGTQKTDGIKTVGALDGVVLKNIDISGNFSASPLDISTVITNINMDGIRLNNTNAGPLPAATIAATTTGFAKDFKARVASGTTYVSSVAKIQWSADCEGFATDGYGGDPIGTGFTGGIEGKVDSVGVQTSTAQSQVGSVSTRVSTGTSTSESVGIQVSTVQSKADSVGIQTSTVDSKVTSSATSVGIGVSTAVSTGQSTGIQVSTVQSKADSVGIQTSTADSKVSSVGIQASTGISTGQSTGIQVSTVQSKADSIGIQASTVDSKVTSSATSVGIGVSTGVSTGQSTGIQVSTVDSKVTSAATSVGIGVSTAVSQASSVGTQASTVGSQVESVSTRLSTAVSTSQSVGVQTSTVDSRVTFLGSRVMKENTVDLATANFTGTATQFTITGGPILVRHLGLLTTTALAAGVNTLKFSFTPTGGAATDLCGATDTASAGISQLFVVDGVKVTALVKTTDVGIMVAANEHMPIVLGTGVIQTIFSAGPPGSGAGTVFVQWEPLAIASAVA